ncbi:MAG TPA: hypothetical protein VNU95_03200 [Candidatus Acidoferrales bacterium]|jgi:TPR repeat protein|nr:hypothetical protein [Candidatus Acidoferrales bacterium]
MKLHVQISVDGGGFGHRSTENSESIIFNLHQITYNTILLFFLAFICTGCHTAKPVYSTNASTILTQQEIYQFEMRAQKGDADAAFKLYEYYIFNTNDRDLSIKWLAIAATNGSASAQYDFGMDYSDGTYPGISNRICAKYWFQCALTNGVDQAAQRLHELDQ